MSEGLPIKKITIIRIITMAGGFLGALVVLSEQKLIWGEGFKSSNVSNVMVAIVGVLCFLNMIRHIRVWRRISKPEAEGNN